MSIKKQEAVPSCSVCGTAMPNAEICRGHILVCENQECRKSVKGFRNRATPKYIKANTIVCSRVGCANYVAEGFYQPNVRFPVCSKRCYKRRIEEVDELICAYPACAQPFRAREGYLKFCCEAHATLQSNEVFVVSRCGKYRDLFVEYIDFASLSKRSISSQRSGLALFFQFINEQGITDLQDVKATTITAFLHWGETTGKPAVWNAIWPVSAFFKWMIALDRRKTVNPVVPSYHRRPKAKRLPRPYSEEEMVYIWSLLDMRGYTVARLAVAIAEESGLRISEIANLRVSDVDLKKQQLFVRLPNKSMTEAWVPFHEKTIMYFKQLITERDSEIEHDFLLCSPIGTPFTNGTLHRALARVLCKSYENKKWNDDGLDSWSTHRLRHTMATRLVAGGANSAAIMAIGRWASFSAMEGYSQVEDTVKSRGYSEAMMRAKKNREKPVKVATNFRKYVNSPT